MLLKPQHQLTSWIQFGWARPVLLCLRCISPQPGLVRARPPRMVWDQDHKEKEKQSLCAPVLQIISSIFLSFRSLPFLFVLFILLRSVWWSCPPDLHRHLYRLWSLLNRFVANSFFTSLLHFKKKTRCENKILIMVVFVAHASYS